jgi:hypothetical protein
MKRGSRLLVTNCLKIIVKSKRTPAPNKGILSSIVSYNLFHTQIASIIQNDHYCNRTNNESSALLYENPKKFCLSHKYLSFIQSSLMVCRWRPPSSCDRLLKKSTIPEPVHLPIEPSYVQTVHMYGHSFCQKNDIFNCIIESHSRNLCFMETNWPRSPLSSLLFGVFIVFLLESNFLL